VPTDVRVFYRECQSLARDGYEVHVVIPTSSSSVVDGVHVHALSRPRSRIVRILAMPWVAMRKALSTRADVYHYHDPELLPAGFVLRWLFRKKVVFDVHEFISRQMLSKLWIPRPLRPVFGVLYRLIERVLTPGQALILANENSLGDYRGRGSVYVVRNYPLLERWTDRIVPVSERKQPPMLVYVGGITEGRGGDVYVDLARRLRERGREFQMMLIGPTEAAYGKAIRGRIEREGLGACVSMSGRLNFEEAMAHVAAATIGLCLLLPMPDHKLLLSTKLLEYMMVGTPVLASAFDAWRSYVEGEGAGLMADPLDLSQVVVTCERMLDDPAGLDAMGRRGAEAVRSRYNWASEFKELERCYRELLNPSGAVK